MTAKELLLAQIDETQYMVEQVLKGWPDGDQAERLHAAGLTVRQQVAHLSECYIAFTTQAKGGSHEWGSWSSGASNLAEELAIWSTNRAEAVATLITSERDEDMKHATDFIVGHDHYHVGQLCALRFVVEPDWNAYAIYR